jgi:hypothetical protein
MRFVSNYVGFRKLIYQYFLVLLLYVLYRGLDGWAFIKSLPLIGMVLMVVATLWKLRKGKDEYQNYLLTQGLIVAAVGSLTWIAAGTIMQRILPSSALDPLLIFPMFWAFLAGGLYSIELKECGHGTWGGFRRKKSTQVSDQQI